jgi:hypothetical protein
MTDFSVFEALMLIAFGVSWPFSIVRSIKARSAEGKSLLYLILLGLAYVSGILHKLIINLDIVIVLYIINFIMVNIDIALYLRNVRIDAIRDSEGKEKLPE